MLYLCINNRHTCVHVLRMVHHCMVIFLFIVQELEPYLSDYLSTKRVKGVECFASTYFHLPENLVDREVIHDNTEVCRHSHVHVHSYSVYMYVFVY